MINFGVIIDFESEDYVYLAEINQLIYLAKIYGGDIATAFIKRMDELEKKSERGSLGSQKILHNDPRLCFIVLSTKEFKDNIAYCKGPVMDSFKFEKVGVGITLNKDDIKKLKGEIIDGDYPIGLKEYVKSLNGIKESKE